MRKIFILLFLVLLSLVTCKEVKAAPFLTCDCTPASDQVTSFGLQFGTLAWIDIPAVDTCGAGTDKVTCVPPAKTICYDMAAQPTGPFVVKAIAKNLWGSSADSLPLSGNKIIPSSPLLLKILSR